MPNQHRIDEVKEYCGYDYYFPEGIFRDFLYINVYKMFNDTIICEPPPTHNRERYEALLEFYNGLEPLSFRGTNPLEKAIYTMKELSRSISMRSLEKGIQEEGENYLRELTAKERELVVEDDIEVIASIMKLVVLLTTKLDGGDKLSIQQKSNKMDSYADVFRAKSSSLVRPDFKHKFVSKSLDVDKTRTEKEGEMAIIYLEDASNSMAEGKGYVISKAIQMVLLGMDTPVHYYRFFSSFYTYEKLEDEEEKMAHFTATQPFYEFENEYRKIVEHLGNTHNKAKVLLSTDAQDYVPNDLNARQLEFNVITYYDENPGLKNLVKRTGGQYLNI
jgi:hypothetical protein